MTTKSVIEALVSLWWPAVEVQVRRGQRSMKGDAENINRDWCRVLEDFNRVIRRRRG